MTPDRNPRRRHLAFLGKAVLSTVLLGWLITRADLGEVWSGVTQAHFPLLALAFLQFLVGYFLTAVRWRVFLRALGIDLGLGYLMQSFAVSVFFSNFLPSTVGGDVVRVYDTWRAGGRKASAFAAVFLGRLIGLFALAAFAVIGLAMSGTLLQENRFLIPVVLGFGGLTLAMVLLVFFIPPRILRLLEAVSVKLPVWSGRGAVRSLLEVALLVRGRTRLFLSTFGLSILLQGNVIVFYFLVGLAIDLPLRLVDYALIVPLASVVMLVPISVNGVGLREGVFALFFGFYGLELSQALTFSWLVYGQILLRGLLGGFIYLIRREPVPDVQQHLAVLQREP